jgi:two-component system OmpR family response regulator
MPTLSYGGNVVKILVIEDDKEAAQYLVKGLREQRHVVDHAANGKEGLFMATSEPYDALLIDRMLPEIDGLTITQTLRASGNKTPILILTALEKVDERVKGLKAGADDYLVKPYSFVELLARLEAITRRTSAEKAETKLTCGDLEMDLLTRTVKRGDREIDLQAREFALLEFLLRHCGTVVTRTMLLEKVWDYNFDPQTNVIDVHISRLRQKIDKGFDKSLIHTLRGAGYKLAA